MILVMMVARMAMMIANLYPGDGSSLYGGGNDDDCQPALSAFGKGRHF